MDTQICAYVKEEMWLGVVKINTLRHFYKILEKEKKGGGGGERIGK